MDFSRTGNFRLGQFLQPSTISSLTRLDPSRSKRNESAPRIPDFGTMPSGSGHSTSRPTRSGPSTIRPSGSGTLTGRPPTSRPSRSGTPASCPSGSGPPASCPSGSGPPANCPSGSGPSTNRPSASCTSVSRTSTAQSIRMTPAAQKSGLPKAIVIATPKQDSDCATPSSSSQQSEPPVFIVTSPSKTKPIEEVATETVISALRGRQEEGACGSAGQDSQQKEAKKKKKSVKIVTFRTPKNTDVMLITPYKHIYGAKEQGFMSVQNISLDQGRRQTPAAPKPKPKPKPRPTMACQGLGKKPTRDLF